MTASAPSRLDVFCPSDAPELDERLTANGYTGGTTTKLARYLIARAMRSKPDERLLPHLMPVEPLIQAMWGEGWINCDVDGLRGALRAMNATARTNRYPVVGSVWYVKAGQKCPKTDVTVTEFTIGYNLTPRAFPFHLSARTVDLPLQAAKIAPAVEQDARLDVQTRHVYSWLLAIGYANGLNRPLKFSRSLFRKAVEESCAVPGLMWSNGTLRSAAKQLKAAGLVKRMHVGERSADENSILLVLTTARDQYPEEVWAAAEASADVSGLPHRMERLTPDKPARLPPAVHGDPSLSAWSKHVYGFLMQRVVMSGTPAWRAPYLIPVAPFIARLNEFAAEQGEEIVPSRVTLAETLNKLKQKGLVQKYGFASQGPHTGCLRFRPPHPRCAYSIQTWEEMEEQGKTEEGRAALWAKAHGGKTTGEAAALTETRETQTFTLIDQDSGEEITLSRLDKGLIGILLDIEQKTRTAANERGVWRRCRLARVSAPFDIALRQEFGERPDGARSHYLKASIRKLAKAGLIEWKDGPLYGGGRATTYNAGGKGLMVKFRITPDGYAAVAAIGKAILDAKLEALKTAADDEETLTPEAEAFFAVLLRRGDALDMATGKLGEITLTQAREDYKSLRPQDRAIGTKLKKAAAVLEEHGFVKWIEGFKKSISKTKILRYRVLDAGVDWAVDHGGGFHPSLREMLGVIRTALEDGADPSLALAEHYGDLKAESESLEDALKQAKQEQAELAIEQDRLHRRVGIGPDALLLMVLVMGKMERDYGAFTELDPAEATVRWDSEEEMKTDYESLAAARKHPLDDQTFNRASVECFTKGLLEVVEGDGYTVRVTEVAIQWANEHGERSEAFLLPLVEEYVLEDGSTGKTEDLIDYIETWRESLDLTSVAAQFPNITLFHESATNNEEIGPYERRALAVHMHLRNLDEEVEQKFGVSPFDVLNVQWECLLTQHERDCLGKTLARLVHGGYAFLPGVDRASPKAMKALRKRAKEAPDEHVPVSMAFKTSDVWGEQYSDVYVKVADRIARRHGATVRRAQLTLPDDTCPCASGQPAEMCCQVHSVNRATALHYGVTVGLAETYRVNGVESAVSDGKVQRNDPCPCWSGKKFKKCCGGAGRTYEGLTAWFAASWRGSA